MDRTKLDSLLSDLSYYNAAESNWSKERSVRNQSKDNLKKYVKELINKGVDVESLYYENKMLTCKSDWGI